MSVKWILWNECYNLVHFVEPSKEIRLINRENKDLSLQIFTSALSPVTLSYRLMSALKSWSEITERLVWKPLFLRPHTLLPFLWIFSYFVLIMEKAQIRNSCLLSLPLNLASDACMWENLGDTPTPSRVNFLEFENGMVCFPDKRTLFAGQRITDKPIYFPRDLGQAVPLS